MRVPQPLAGVSTEAEISRCLDKVGTVKTIATNGVHEDFSARGDDLGYQSDLTPDFSDTL
jgi:hypothetical protein